MAAIAREAVGSRACRACLRRAWLVAAVGGPLDYLAHDRRRLVAALSLADEELIEAVGGRRRAELRTLYERFQAEESCPTPGTEAVCRHDPLYPRALDSAAAPHVLNVAGGSARLAELAAAPVVAIVGSARASDYGVELAGALGRGLAAAGVTVAAGLATGVAAAAHTGALGVGGRPLAVMHGGLAVACPARARSLYARVRHAGCAVSELPSESCGRRWGRAASERILAELGGLTVVVEAEDSPRDLAVARMAEALGRPVAAIPGRVTSRLSSGANALLLEGAQLVRGAEDVLELLYRGGVGRPPRESVDATTAVLSPRLRATLERVGAGSDTPDELIGGGADPDEVLLRLSELELMGLLGRGDGGRYVVRSTLRAT